MSPASSEHMLEYFLDVNQRWTSDGKFLANISYDTFWYQVHQYVKTVKYGMFSVINVHPFLTITNLCLYNTDIACIKYNEKLLI
jgi:hypothetical protein